MDTVLYSSEQANEKNDEQSLEMPPFRVNSASTIDLRDFRYGTISKIRTGATNDTL